MAGEGLSIAISGARGRELDLVDRHRSGDESAFESVYAAHADRVYGLCLRLSGSPEDAGDLAQEVFLRVHRHLGRFAGRSTLGTWIWRIALNVCRSRLARRRPPALGLEEAIAGGEPRAIGESPEEAAALAEHRRRVVSALVHLPVKLRIAVILRDVEGLSYEEIARVERLPMGTVRSRIARGREALRERLEEGR
jgi:RNA polymerase sigma-70 factor (ECF subfamily)